MLDQPHRIGRHRHGAHRLLVAGVPDVEHGVALPAPHLELVVDLGDQGADRVDHHAALGPGRGHHLGGRAMGTEHERRARRHVGHVVDEDRPPAAEAVDHVPVVHDLVVAVDGGFEDPHHPGQGLDRLLHAGAEPPGLGQQDPFDVGHLLNATGTPPPASSGPSRPGLERDGRRP